MPPPASKRLRIGSLAQQSGLSRDSLRHYERIGLLPAPGRTPGGFREYLPDAVRRVVVIQRALAMGFTLAELTRFFAERKAGRPPCLRVHAIAGKKLLELDATIEELRGLRNKLRKTLTVWDARLAETGAGQPAALLDGLADLSRSDVGGARRPSRRLRSF